jgi:hypothetical protein
LQGSYYVIALVNDFIGSNKPYQKNPPCIKRVVDYIFTSQALSVSLTVSVLFWILYTVNRELVFPKVFDVVLPLWMTLAIHTVPTVWILIELIAVHHQNVRVKVGLSSVLVMGTAYIVLLLFLHHLTGVWVYPVCGKLNTWQLYSFLFSVEAVFVLCYFTGRKINSSVWRQGPTEATSYDL